MSFLPLIRRYAAIAALLVAPAAAAQATVGCKVIDPELQASYTGGCKDGSAEGYGEARGTANYRGEFKAGRKHGKGIKAWPTSGDRYEGDFVEDRKQGQGVYAWGQRSPFAGEKYTGEWLSDKRHGQGIYEWPNGDRYSGAWKNDGIDGPPTKSMIARARGEAERAAAVGRPGVKVCREMLVGVVTRDVVRGTVTAAQGERISIRIDEPGRFEHIIGERQLQKSMVVSDFTRFWVPCI